MKRTAKNEPQAGTSQIIRRELEDVPEGVLSFLPLRESLKRTINKKRQRNFPPNPKSILDLERLPPDERFLFLDTFRLKITFEKLSRSTTLDNGHSVKHPQKAKVENPENETTEIGTPVGLVK